MGLASQNADLTRRRAILATLLFEPGRTASARCLRDQVEAVHGQVATVDRVRADIIWLADIGMVKVAGDMATLTEGGVDVVSGRAVLPGQT